MPTSKTWNFALIGCGRVAGHHARAIAQIEGAQLVAVCDLQKELGQALADEHGVPFYANYFEMLQQHPEIDIVNIVTPSGMHPEHATHILGTFGKHLVIEKPFVMTPVQGESLMALAQEKGARIYPVYQNRYNPAVRRLRQAVESGELGDLTLCTVRVRWCRPQRYYDRHAWRGTFSHDGGAMTNQGIHYLDLLRYLGGDILRVQAMLKTLGAEIEVEDTAVGLVEFKNGASGVVEITTAARPDDFEASISIMGSKGFAMLGGLATNQLITFTPDPEQTKTAGIEIPDAYGYGHIDMFEQVVADLEGKPADLVSAADGLETIRLLHALYQSDEEGRWVEMNPQVCSTRLGREDDTISALYRTTAP